ncbi:MAG: class I SAM-dependent methyltransferase [Chloroflexi bacterium]|nr:class I SAM-dependent methyltransferase [Chloroflexota bacterium]
MHNSAIAHLGCVICHRGALRLHAVIHWQTSAEVQTGITSCAYCGATFPIREGILDLLLPDSLAQLNLANRSNHLAPIAWGYEDLWRRRSLALLSGRPFSNEQELDLVSRMFFSSLPPPAQEGTKLFLDLACSTALYARGLARRLPPTSTTANSTEIIAIDNAWPMLKMAQAKLTHQPYDTIPISLVRADAANLPFLKGTLHGVVCGGSLNEFNHPQAVLQELTRVLSPGAPAVTMSLLQASSSMLQSWVQSAISNTSGIKFWTAPKIRQMFQNAGFRLLEEQILGIVAVQNWQAL